MKHVLFAVLLLSAAGIAQTPTASTYESLPFAPRHAIVYRTAAPITIDGRLDEPAWQAAAWSDAFVDIQGGAHPAPRFSTRAKMLWDDRALYIAAEMQEPDLWGTLTTRDSVIFRDNDFEVFIDPDGDTHNYYEFETNVLGTAWDLFLPLPYRDGGPPINAWDIAGLAVATSPRGTLNHPGDRDEGWTVEIAMPWTSLAEAAFDHRAPRPGEQWRINFSRVEWQVDAKDGRYVKRTDAASQPLPEDNWVWSPQGAIDMHMPERWGFMQFSAKAAGTGSDAFVDDPNEQVKWALRRLYYRQRDYRAAHGAYARDLAALHAEDIHVDGLAFHPTLETTDSLYEIRAAGFTGAVVHIRQDGLVWITR